jgi:hypothetical protein
MPAPYWKMIVGSLAFLTAPSGSSLSPTDFLKLGKVEGTDSDPRFSGETAQGVKFNFIPDYAGDLIYEGKEFRGRKDIWVVVCNPDHEARARKCTLSWTYPAFLEFRFDKNAKLDRVCASNNYFQSDKPLLQVNGGGPSQGDDYGCFYGEALSRISSLKVGDRVRVTTFHSNETGVVETDSRVTPAYRVAIDMANFYLTYRDKKIPWSWWDWIWAWLYMPSRTADTIK